MELSILWRCSHDDRNEDAHVLNSYCVGETGGLAIAVGHNDGEGIRANLRRHSFKPAISVQDDPRRELATHLVGVVATSTGSAQLVLDGAAYCY